MQHGDDALLDAVDEHALHGGDVVDHAGDDVARGALVVPTQRQALQRAVEIAAKIEDDFLLEGVVEADAQGVERVLREKRRDDDEHIGQQQVGLVRNQDVVDDQTGDFGKDESGQRAEMAQPNVARQRPG